MKQIHNQYLITPATGIMHVPQNRKLSKLPTQIYQKIKISQKQSYKRRTNFKMTGQKIISKKMVTQDQQFRSQLHFLQTKSIQQKRKRSNNYCAINSTFKQEFYNTTKIHNNYYHCFDNRILPIAKQHIFKTKKNQILQLDFKSTSTTRTIQQKNYQFMILQYIFGSRIASKKNNPSLQYSTKELQFQTYETTTISTIVQSKYQVAKLTNSTCF
eukprot:TRINITY_DN31472_c0_g1_i2.p3 TRINITY_DN31472_c0_g1~~TRINITY_DN31472_c0_g1_i2.p3  ORF type:complete len:214 (+),score=-11.71 TRINITY_DN31472_c0_g1_i2:779-1420(+)